MRFLAIGDNCIDHYKKLNRRFPGGNALNVAVYANRIPGVEADYFGVIGKDEAGDFLVRQMKLEGLNTAGVIRLSGLTAVTTILIRDGDRIFVDYTEGVQKNAEFPKTLLKKVTDYDIIHFSVWGFGREHIPAIKTNCRAKLSCDFSNQLHQKTLEIMPYLDYSFFSGKELITKGIDPEKIIKELKNQTPGLVVMTLGEFGSLSFDGEELYASKATKVDVVDTLGAGDSYIAAFLFAHLVGETIPEAMNMGHIAATETCKRLGGWGGN
jgi:fructoselysine 6-kinase